MRPSSPAGPLIRRAICARPPPATGSGPALHRAPPRRRRHAAADQACAVSRVGLCRGSARRRGGRAAGPPACDATANAGAASRCRRGIDRGAAASRAPDEIRPSLPRSGRRRAYAARVAPFNGADGRRERRPVALPRPIEPEPPVPFPASRRRRAGRCGARRVGAAHDVEQPPDLGLDHLGWSALAARSRACNRADRRRQRSDAIPGSGSRR